MSRFVRYLIIGFICGVAAKAMGAGLIVALSFAVLASCGVDGGFRTSKS